MAFTDHVSNTESPEQKGNQEGLSCQLRSWLSKDIKLTLLSLGCEKTSGMF